MKKTITTLLILLSIFGGAIQLFTSDFDKGLLYGLFNGFTIMSSFFGSLITDSIKIYYCTEDAIYYNAGFMAGLLTLFLGGFYVISYFWTDGVIEDEDTLI